MIIDYAAGLPDTVIHTVEQIPQQTDLVVVLGKNQGHDWSKERVLRTPDLLSPDSCINVLAAGLVWTPGRKILFSGGMKVGENFYQGDAAKRYFEKKYPYIPQEDLLTETGGYSTPKSAEAVGKVMARDGFKHLALLTVGYHQVYAPISFEQYGVPVESAIASEDILAQRSHYFAQFIARWKQSDRISREVEYAAQKLHEIQTTDISGVVSDERTRKRAE